MYFGVTAANVVELGRMNVRTDVNEITVNVRITNVTQVKAVLIPRFRILEIPRLKAAAEAASRPTSALYTFEACCFINSNCSSNFLMMIATTSTDKVSTIKATRIIIGVAVIWKAGWT